MIVVDASAVAELLLETSKGAAVARRLRGNALHAPAHFDVEVASVIRRAIARELISDRDGIIAIAEFQRLAIRRWSVPPLLDRAFALRDSHTVADAVYLALAEGLACPLLTCDERLARSHGHNVEIQLPD